MKRTRSETPLGQHLEDVEKDFIIRYLYNLDGNVTHVAKAIGLSHRQLCRLIQKHGIRVDNYRKVPRSPHKIPLTKVQEEQIRRRAQHQARAQRMVYKALESGTLNKPEACQKCNKNKPLDAHHPDYDFPLAVAWLCRQCHANTHMTDVSRF